MEIKQRVEKARRDLLYIKEMAGEGALAGELVEVEQYLRQSIRSLPEALGRWDTLKDSGFLSAALRAEGEKLKEEALLRTTKFKERLGESPPNPKGGRDLKNLVDSVTALRKRLDEITRQVWEKSVADSLSPIDARMGVAAPGQDDLLARVKRLVDRLRREWSTPPSSSNKLKEYRALLGELESAAAGLSSLEIPPKVKVFLERVAMPQGAQFFMLTPEIFEWLLNHKEIRGSLVIRRR